jgi:hydroxymethylbilane synthase
MAAERAALAALDGSCRTPIAAHARVAGDRLSLDALVALPDGSAVFRTSREGAASGAAAMGTDAGTELRARAPASLFAEL